MKKKILLLNQGDTQNYGDIAIHKMIDTYFRENGFNTEFYPFWSEDKVFGKNIFLQKILTKLFWKNVIIMDLLNAIAIKKYIKKNNYDAIIVGGGELLSGHRGFNSSLNIWSKFAANKKIPIFLLGVSGDIHMPKYLLKRNKKSLSRFKLISVRDGKTKDILNNYYHIKCDLAPDVVFAYNKICPPTEKRKKTGTLMCVPIQYNKLIQNNMNIYTTEKYYEYLLKLIKNNLDKNINKIIITVSVLEDINFSKDLYSYLKKRITDISLIYMHYSKLDEYIELCQKSKVVISGRMHALILALINDNKVIPIPFKEKLECFKKEYCGIQKIELIEMNVMKEFEKVKKLINAN